MLRPDFNVCNLVCKACCEILRERASRDRSIFKGGNDAISATVVRSLKMSMYRGDMHELDYVNDLNVILAVLQGALKDMPSSLLHAVYDQVIQIDVNEVLDDSTNLHSNMSTNKLHIRDSIREFLVRLPSEKFDLSSILFGLLHHVHTNTRCEVNASGIALEMGGYICRHQESAFMSIRHRRDLVKIIPVIEFIIRDYNEIYRGLYALPETHPLSLAKNRTTQIPQPIASANSSSSNKKSTEEHYQVKYKDVNTEHEGRTDHASIDMSSNMSSSLMLSVGVCDSGHYNAGLYSEDIGISTPPSSPPSKMRMLASQRMPPHLSAQIPGIHVASDVNAHTYSSRGNQEFSNLSIEMPLSSTSSSTNIRDRDYGSGGMSSPGSPIMDSKEWRIVAQLSKAITSSFMTGSLFGVNNSSHVSISTRVMSSERATSLGGIRSLASNNSLTISNHSADVDVDDDVGDTASRLGEGRMQDTGMGIVDTSASGSNISMMNVGNESMKSNNYGENEIDVDKQNEHEEEFSGLCTSRSSSSSVLKYNDSNNNNAHVSTTSLARERKILMIECRSLKSSIAKFESSFASTHKHKPVGEERSPLSSTYSRYRDIKRSIRDLAAKDIQRILRGGLIRNKLRSAVPLPLLRTAEEPQIVPTLNRTKFNNYSSLYDSAQHMSMSVSMEKLELSSDSPAIGREQGSRQSEEKIVTRTTERDNHIQLHHHTQSQANDNEKRNHSHVESKNTTINHKSSGAGAGVGAGSTVTNIASTTGPSSLPRSQIEEYESLLSEKSSVKKQLKKFDSDFLSANGRVPTKKDKEKIRPLYQRYHDIKLNLETLKSEIESVGDSQMIQALIDVNATSNGSDENRFLSKNEIGKLGSTFRRSGNGNGMSIETEREKKNEKLKSSASSGVASSSLLGAEPESEAQSGSGLGSHVDVSTLSYTSISPMTSLDSSRGNNLGKSGTSTGGSSNSGGGGSGSGEATELEKLQLEKKNLHAYLKAYERDFNSRHGRPVMQHEDILPVANEYSRYKSLKSLIDTEKSKAKENAN